MKIDLNILSPEDFITKDVNIFGIEAILIYPKMFPKWNDNNRYFRSSLWRKSDLKPLSLLWRKFVNLGEQPDFEVIDYNKPIEYIQKLDGSALGISKINGNICARTRQTIDARNLENGHEIDLFIQKYPLLFNNSLINSESVTILTEWTTPTNKICLEESTEPKLWLTGAVRHEDYSYLPQDQLDRIAVDCGLERPKRYTFNSLEDATNFSSEQTEIEGLVLYCNNGQVLKKCKSLYYLKIHRFKANATLDNILDLFISFGKPSYDQFCKKIELQFDYECLKLCLDLVDKVYQAYLKVVILVKELEGFAELLYVSNAPRKDKAVAILSKYKESGLSGYVFQLLDRKQLGDKEYKKLIEREFGIN